MDKKGRGVVGWGRSGQLDRMYVSAESNKDIEVNRSEGQTDVPQVVFRSFVELSQHSISYL
jgi:hypothetical protein